MAVWLGCWLFILDGTNRIVVGPAFNYSYYLWSYYTVAVTFCSLPLSLSFSLSLSPLPSFSSSISLSLSLFLLYRTRNSRWRLLIRRVLKKHLFPTFRDYTDVFLCSSPRQIPRELRSSEASYGDLGKLRTPHRASEGQNNRVPLMIFKKEEEEEEICNLYRENDLVGNLRSCNLQLASQCKQPVLPKGS